MNKRQAKKKANKEGGITKERLRRLKKEALKAMDRAFRERTKEARDLALMPYFSYYVWTGRRLPGDAELIKMVISDEDKDEREEAKG